MKRMKMSIAMGGQIFEWDYPMPQFEAGHSDKARVAVMLSSSLHHLLIGMTAEDREQIGEQTIHNSAQVAAHLLRHAAPKPVAAVETVPIRPEKYRGAKQELMWFDENPPDLPNGPGTAA